MSSCCSPTPAHAAHLGAAVTSSAGSAPIQPANLAAANPTGATADTLVVGTIATGVPGAPTAEAMAISGGKIIGIGSMSDVESLVGPSTTTVKPDGIVTPGLVEPHMHIWTSLLNYTWTDMSHVACPTFDDVVALVKSTAAQTPAGQYVLGKLFDPSLYPGEPDLTRAILDQVAPNNPVLVWNASGHFMYANTAAFEMVSITAQTADPAGGFFYRANGELTGVIGEPAAIQLMIAKLPKPTAAEVTSSILGIMNAAAAVGVTSMRDAATGALVGPAELGLLHQMNGAKRLPVRLSTAQFAAGTGGKSPADVAAAWKAAGVTPFSGDEMVRADAWKIVSDGSNQGRSGYFLQPYLGENNGGHADFTPEDLRALIKAGLDDGWQLMTHTNGDAAVEFVLTAYEEMLPGYGKNDLRHRMEHVSFTTDDQLARMVAAGVSPSFLMNHVYYWGAAFRDTILGPERAGRLDRVASAYKAGLRPSLHSDYNVTEIQPLLSARTAVLRNLQADGSILNPAECATPEQALTAITTNAAWQIHADDRGTLEVGKRADFALMSENPWTSDAATWADIKVYATYIDGTTAWQS